jgi:HK97 family phage major capsid protein
MFTPVLPDKPTEAHYREQLKAAGEYLHGLRGVERDKRDDSWKADVQSAAEFIHEADPILTALERSAPRPQAQIVNGLAVPQNADMRSFGNMLLDSDEYKNAGPVGWGASRAAELEIRGSLFANNSGFRITSGDTSGGAFLPVGQPIPPKPRQMRLFLRDVIDVAETGLSAVPYIRETSPTSNEYGASAVSEGSAKPEVQMNWELDEAAVRKIAAWVTVTSEIIDDAPTLRSYIDGRLAYMLAIREEYEILNGSGSAPHLKGILQYADLQLQTGVSDKPVALGLAIGKIENVDGEANGIAMNPLDYWAMITTRVPAATGEFDGQAEGGSAPIGGPFGTVWGLPVVRSRAITSGQALVGAWSLGATLFDRMQTRIVVGNQHSDYFTNNKIAVLAEERVALAVHRPDFFVKVTF